MIDKRYLELIYHRSIAGLKDDAARFSLGVLWWLLDPILYLVVFYLLFDKILSRGGPDFVPFLLCGLIFWRWFDSSVKQSAMSIQSARNIIGQVYVPKMVLPSSVLLTVMLQFFLVLVVLLGFLLLYGYRVQWAWVCLLPVMAVQLLLTVGVSWFLAALVPFLPDLNKLIGYGMTLMFFMSGIFFDINTVSEPARSYLALNPMAVLIDCYRGILLRGEIPQWMELIPVLGIGSVLLWVGGWLLVRYDRYYPRLVG